MPKYFNTVLHLVGLFIILYLGVDLFYRVVEERFVQPPPSRITAPQRTIQSGQKTAKPEDFQAILQRNIFGAVSREEGKVEAVEVENLQPTKLRLDLLGTIAGEDQDARAIIQDETARKQDLYRIGDTVQGATIRQIFRNKVVLHVNNRDEVLTMEESSRASQPGETERRESRGQETTATPQEVDVNRSDIQESLTNINQILTQVRIRPYFKDGKPDGLIISHLQPDSMFTTLGLQNGDIIRTIDGNPIKTPDDAIALYEHLKTGSSISIEVTRRGRPEILNYNIRE